MRAKYAGRRPSETGAPAGAGQGGDTQSQADRGRGDPPPCRAPRAVVEAPPPPPPTLVAYPAPIYQSRYGTWALGFGNTEDRSAVGSTTINCCTGPVAGGIPNILTISEKSSSNTFGFLGGIRLYVTQSLPVRTTA